MCAFDFGLTNDSIPIIFDFTTSVAKGKYDRFCRPKKKLTSS